MKIIKTVKEMQEIADSIKKENKTIACVPTMGFLHKGHLSLVSKGKEIADYTVTTLFVNPTQFAPNEDFDKYPRDFERDRKLLEDLGSDFIFAPDAIEMYPSGYDTEINIKGISQSFEGKFRPIHFNGVATVVAKLFMATKANFAIFGQKDFQQSLVVKQMVRDMLMDIEIIVAPIIREEDGLARSSRNIYLNPDERKVANTLYLALNEAKKIIINGERNKNKINETMVKFIEKTNAFRIDYAASADANNLSEPEIFSNGQEIVLLIAAYLGKTRLIDNCVIKI